MLTLSSDFGSPYPAAMKGVILTRSDARLVDVTHDLPRQDVRAAAFWLRETLPYFPPGTHLVVVDPGVGTDRAAIVVRAGEHTLVGPDNGVCFPPARRLADGGPIETYTIDERHIEPVEPASGSGIDESAPPNGGQGPASNTFHGRDVFAPASAVVHDTPIGALAELEFLTPAETAVELELPTATVTTDRADGEVLVVDDFGNVITNVPGSYLADRERIVANGDPVPVGETFAVVPVGDRLATIGSHGYVELDVNQGRGDEAFGLTAGDGVVLESAEEN